MYVQYNIWLSCIGGIPCVLLNPKKCCKRCEHLQVQIIRGMDALVMCIICSNKVKRT